MNPLVSVVIPCYGHVDAARAAGTVPKGCEVILSARDQTPADARENGLKRANGEWITFLDADDEFTADFLPELASLPESVVQAIFRVHDDNTGEVRPADNVFLHGKFYRRSWWKERQIKFPPVRTNEDAGIYVTVNGLLYTEDVARSMTAAIEKTVYRYHANPDSMTHKNPNYNRDSIPDYLFAVIGTLSCRPDIDEAWKRRQCERCIAQCRLVDDGSHEKEITEYERMVKKLCLKS